MTNHYINSWELYKAYHKDFDLDFEYYLNLCKGYKTLELFAGFGRLTNYLYGSDVDIESVELENNFANSIVLPKEKNHQCNVLNFETEKKFDRIIAGVNSFCLLTDAKEINKFFKQVSNWLKEDGIASFSYYHPNYWHIGNDDKIYFEHLGDTVEYTTTFDFSKRQDKIAVWTDIYRINNQILKFDYPTRVYETNDCLTPFLENAGLKLINAIKNYHHPNLEYPGWVEFVITKK